MRLLSIALASASIVTIAIAAESHAATIHVPANSATIGGALAIASFGDTVFVAPGTYRERLRLVDGVLLRAARPSVRPVIEAEGTGIAISASSCGSVTTVQGFVIRGGESTTMGGGALLVDSSTIFRDCLFEKNAAPHGGGVGGERSSFTLVNCEFRSNTAAQSGGAVAVTGGGTPRIVNCTFSGNDALAGGAIAVRNGTTPMIQASLFERNAAQLGAVIWFDLLTGGSVERNTMVFSEDRGGGAIYVNAASTPSIVTNIVAYGSGRAIVSTAGASHEYGCNDFFANGEGDEVTGGIDLGTNISADPLFCDARSGDYFLQPDSPCLPPGPCSLVGRYGPGTCSSATSSGAGLKVIPWGKLKSFYR